MSDKSGQGDLFEHGGSVQGVVHVSAQCVMRTKEGDSLVLVAGIPLLHFSATDAMGRAHAMVSLVEQGWATQVEVARAFRCTTRTVRRCLQRFEHGGLGALGRCGGYPSGRSRRPESRARLVRRLKAEGLSHRDIAARIGVTENAVRESLARQGWKPNAPAQLPLAAEAASPSPAADDAKAAPAREQPNLSASSDEEPLPFTCDTDPADRRMDRFFACIGLLDDAAPLFRAGTRVPHAGVLLALPSLLATGVLDCAREVFGSLAPAFYGLRTSIVSLLLLALLRIKRPEALKEHSPQDLGRLLGLDRAPEVKTLRRKLARLAATGRAAEFGRALARRRVAAHGAVMGLLYVDGHVRVYHGRHEIPYAHVARMRIAMPATTDYWVNDARGEPLFVVTAEANDGLVKALPSLLAQMRELVGTRRLTVVFDRGGWSPRLFQELLAQGFELLTYRKGRSRRVPRRLFHERKATIDGRHVVYTLADQEIRLLKGRLRLRQVTRRTENGHQTPIVTSRRDLADVEVAHHMFDRWRQENFFKYLREEYALDALVEHAVEPADATREVPNPAWAALAAEIRSAHAEVERASALYGIDAFASPERVRRTMRGFRIAHAQGGRELTGALERLTRLEARRAKVPHRVPVKDVVEGAVVRLATERQHLANVLKMVAYQAEGDLVRRIRPHYRRAGQEGRTLVASALACAGDIDLAPDELRVTLAPMSSPHRSRAVAALCEDLNREPVRFPGTRLRMRFAVALQPEKRTNS